jgi:hypothetical protein
MGEQIHLGKVVSRILRFLEVRFAKGTGLNSSREIFGGLRVGAALEVGTGFHRYSPEAIGIANRDPSNAIVYGLWCPGNLTKVSSWLKAFKGGSLLVW